jgi:23S rRNA (adenine2503-C2)-methyltransferase
MSVEKVYPIKEIISLLKKYDFSHQRRVSFEYIMFAGYNDSIRHAQAVVDLLSGLECRVNLIRFHEIPGVELKTSDNEQMIKFRDFLSAHRIVTTIRKSRGEDIFAACGMLSTLKKEKEEN